MSDKVNKVEYEGRVFSVRDLRHTPQGSAVCNARMKVSKRFDGEWQSVWFDVTAWESAAETLAECQDKDDVIVRGRLSVSRPFTRRDGTTVDPGIVLNVNEVERVGSFSPPASTPVQSSDWEDVPF